MIVSSFDNLVFCRSWGFLCPVHTPDGEPCGLLNHLTSTCSTFAVPLMCLSMNCCTYLWVWPVYKNLPCRDLDFIFSLYNHL